MADKHYGMAIDTGRCVGCQTCTVGCKISNEVPGSAQWNHVINLNEDAYIYQSNGAYPATSLAFRPLLCNHCEDPACVHNCPTGAMHKDANTGIVSVSQDVCIACGYCAWVCPYGAPSMDDVHHVMSKCNFCMDRVSEGYVPYCVDGCPANARIFGDLNDPESDVSKIIAQKHGMPYKPEDGTKPSVYYL